MGFSDEEKRGMKERIKKNFFSSFIWCSYRRNFEKELLSDSISQRFLKAISNDSLKLDEKYSGDMNWGCTLRVG
jgi:Peptidase family C54